MTETRELEHKGIKGYCKYTLYDQKDRGKYEHCEEKWKIILKDVNKVKK